MLNTEKKYYVSAGSYLKSVIESWASENTMKLIGEEIALPTRERVYELDVRYNDDLSIAMKLLGSGRPNFLNGKRVIGGVTYDNALSESRVVIWPVIRDR